MTKINLPNGAVIDFKDAPQEVIEKEITNLRNTKPELFEEKVDYSTISFQDLQKHVRAKAGSRASEDEVEVEVTHPELEVASHGFQFFYGKADNDEERAARLESVFGPATYQRLGHDNFILLLDKISPEKKAEHSLPDSGTMPVNRKGFSRYDLSRFGGAYRGPLLTTLAAGLYTTGIGILPAMGVMFAAGATGKGLDEYQEHLEGFQRQESADVYKDMAIEGGLMAAGEGLFRGIFNLIRRVWKGPGPKPSEQRIEQLVEQGVEPQQALRLATEEARVVINKLTRSGAVPNIEEATGKAFLGRMQAIYEAILPNRTAARKNSDYIKGVMSQYAKGDLTEAQMKKALNDQATAISKVIKDTMADPDEAVRLAQRHLRDVIEAEFNEINKIISKGVPKGELTGTMAQDFATALSDAARLFKQDSHILYNNAEKALGRNIPLFDAGPLRKGIKELEKSIFEAQGKQGLRTTPLIQFLEKKIAGEATDFTGKPLSKNFSISELNSLRAALNAERNNPALISSQINRQATEMITQIDRMLLNEELRLGEAIAKHGIKAGLSRTGKGGGVPLPGTKGMVSPAKVEEIRSGLNLLKEARLHYQEGQALFNTESANLIINTVRQGTWVDLTDVSKFIVQGGKPEQLKRWLNIVEPSKAQIGKLQSTSPEIFTRLEELALQGNAKAFNMLARESGLLAKGPGGKQLVREMPEWINGPGMRADDPFRVGLIEDVSSLMKMHAADATARRSAPVVRDRIRDMLGNQWMKDALDASLDSTGKVNIGQFGAQFMKLGRDQKMQKLLFGDNYKRLNEVVNDAFVVNGLKGQPLKDIAAIQDTLYLPAVREEIGRVGGIIRQAQEDGQSALFNAIRTGKIDDMDTLVTGLLAKPQIIDGRPVHHFDQLINRISTTQGKEAAETASEGIKDMVMARIVNTSFPEGITPQGIQTGGFGELMEKTVTEMNKNGALARILGSQETVNGLLKVSKDAALVSNRAFKGKAGLAPAVFIAGAGLRLITAPLAFAGELATIFGLGKILRSPRFLRMMTNPQLRAAEVKQARGLGIDLGEDIISYGSRRRSEVLGREARAATSLAIGSGFREGTEIAKEKVGPIASEVLREVERDKLIGVR